MIDMKCVPRISVEVSIIKPVNLESLIVRRISSNIPQIWKKLFLSHSLNSHNSKEALKNFSLKVRLNLPI